MKRKGTHDWWASPEPVDETPNATWVVIRDAEAGRAFMATHLGESWDGMDALIDPASFVSPTPTSYSATIEMKLTPGGEKAAEELRAMFTQKDEE